MQFNLKYVLISMTVLAAAFAIFGLLSKRAEKFSRNVDEQHAIAKSIDTIVSGFRKHLLEDPSISDSVTQFIKNNPSYDEQSTLLVHRSGGLSASRVNSGLGQSKSKYSTNRDYTITWPSSTQIQDQAGNQCRLTLNFESKAGNDSSSHEITIGIEDDHPKTKTIVDWLANQIETEIGIIPVINSFEPATN